MLIHLYKDFHRSDVQPLKKRVKYGKGKIESKAQGDAFNHYETTAKSARLEVGSDLQRQEAKLHQTKNTFISKGRTSNMPLNNVISHSRTQKLDNTSKNRVFCEKQGYSYVVTNNGTKLLVNCKEEDFEYHKGRFTSTKTKGRGSVNISLKSSLHEVLTRAFLLSKKDLTKGFHVLNVKIKVINPYNSESTSITNGRQIRGLMGTRTKGAINIHEVRVDRIILDKNESIKYIVFNKETLKKYANLMDSIEKYIELGEIEDMKL